MNADDFGQSRGVNEGVVEAHERGIVTSASLMVRWPAAAEAADYARASPRLGLGLHLDLGEWLPEGGAWRAVYEVVPREDEGAVAAEIERQFRAFGELVGAPPTHLDSHQHVHRNEPARTLYAEHARRLGVPLRHAGPVRYCGLFYGQDDAGEPLPEAIAPEALVRLVRGLPAGATELCCHPGRELELETAYLGERAVEVEALCDPRVRAAIAEEGIELTTFAAL